MMITNILQAVLSSHERGQAVFYEPADNACRRHDWRQEAGTARHDYEVCRKEHCQARRIMDRRPGDPPTETVDVSWVCRGAEQPSPDPRRCAPVHPTAADLALR